MRTQRAVALATVILIVGASPAFAQLGLGGAGSGVLTQLIQWVLTNIVQALLGAAVILVGMMLMWGHHTVAGIITVIVGAVVISQWQTIAGFFGVG